MVMFDRNADALTELCVDDLLRAFKLSRTVGPWRGVAGLPARRFARLLREFDACVVEHGLVASGQFILDRFTRSVTITGAEELHKSGPMIVACNHPGMTDAMAVWTAIGREDLKIIAAERELLRHLPNIQKHLILVQPHSTEAIREAISHLKAGGSLLTFPAGRIEPDIRLRKDGISSLDTWSPSVAKLAARLPGVTLVTGFVEGVISERANRAVMLRYLREPTDRDWAAATLQILLPFYRKVDAKVRFRKVEAATSEAIYASMVQSITEGASERSWDSSSQNLAPSKKML